ncbi:transglycosylase domain-containing protein [Streptomyces sp. JV190]|uniref:transglycosylase domain-containing protein n=1 Tax=Streptomyces sp. JV190 TaxID=3002533 RepID=UPI002E76EA59|nr:transglycosylase domain-containing protein [Streptomyces sp. JV190]MEE1838225.1 transglycosylase domain-containing protein [Streptomyces sp. JV190]
MGIFGIAFAMVGLPKVNTAAKAQINVDLGDDGSQKVATGGEVTRQMIRFELIPEALGNAVMSAENMSFVLDGGMDPLGIAGALFNLATGGVSEGGSTFSQLLVKKYRLCLEQSLSG